MSLTAVCIFGVLLTTDLPECKVESDNVVGVVDTVEEVPTSFNDFRRMKVTVISHQIGDVDTYDMNSGTYFVMGLANVRDNVPVHLLKTSCGTRIKFGETTKMFRTFEFE